MAGQAIVLGLVLGLTPASASADLREPVPAQREPGEPGDPPPKPTPGRAWAPVLVTGSLTLASASAAIVYTVRVVGLRRSLAADLGARVQYDQADRRLAIGRREAFAAASLAGATAVLAGLTLYLLLRRSGPIQSRRAWSLAPGFGRGEAALVLRVGL